MVISLYPLSSLGLLNGLRHLYLPLTLSVSLISLTLSEAQSSQSRLKDDMSLSFAATTPSATRVATPSEKPPILQDPMTASTFSPSSQSQKTLRQSFEHYLDTLGQQLYQARLPLLRQAYNCYQPTIFISYAWEPDIKNWVDQTLSRDLKRLGFDVLYDQERNIAESSLPQFENKVADATYVVLVGTPQYMKRYLENNSNSYNASTGVGREVEKIVRRLDQPDHGKILPIYRKGTYSDCVLPLLNYLVALPATDERHYYKTMFDLSQTLFMYDTLNAEPIATWRQNFMTLLDEENAQVLREPPHHQVEASHRFATLDLATRYQQLYQHTFGSTLDLAHFTPQTTADMLIIDVLKPSLSVRTLNLTKAHLQDPHYLSLSAMLYDNMSLQHLTLKDALCSEKAWILLSQALVGHSTLTTFVPPQFSFPFKAIHLENFYSQLTHNATLHTIIWPFHLTSDLGKNLLKLGEHNRAAALHCSQLIDQALSKDDQAFASHRPSETSSSLINTLFWRDPRNLISLQQQLKYLQIAVQSDHPSAVYIQAQYHEQENFKKEALAMYQRAADLNHPLANLWMGEYYRGVWKKKHRTPDYGRTYTHYQCAALQGNAEAHYRLGKIQETQKISGFNLSDAIKSYQKAAARGHPKAFITLIRLHSDPNSTVYDLDQAFFYQEQAKPFSLDSEVHRHHQNLAQTHPQLK